MGRARLLDAGDDGAALGGDRAQRVRRPTRRRSRRRSSRASSQQLRADRRRIPPLVWLEHWIARGRDAGGGGRRARHRARRAHAAHDGEQHHQPARHRAHRLARRSSSGRAPSRRRCGRTRRGLRADDVRDARPAIGTWSSGSPSGATATRRRSRRDAIELARSPRRPTGRARRIGAATSATTWWTRDWRSSSGPPAIGRRSGERLYRWALRHPNVVFFGGVVAGTRRGARWPCSGSPGPRRARRWPLVLLVALIPANDIAVSVDEPARHGVPAAAHACPSSTSRRRRRLPEEFRTAVVVPTLFGSVEAVREALEHLEVQYLANRDAASAVRAPQRLHRRADRDAARRRGDPRGRGGRHSRAQRASTPTASEDAFYLFHRPRRWNPQPGRVDGLGAEARQAGRVQSLPPRRRPPARSPTIVGDPRRSGGVRYVITLDADTVLPPRRGARCSIGTMAHPLNRAEYDPELGRVVARLRHPAAARRRVARRARTARASRRSTRAIPASTRTRRRCPTCTRTCTARGASPARASTTSTRSSRRPHGRFPENTLLATT